MAADRAHHDQAGIDADADADGDEARVGTTDVVGGELMQHVDAGAQGVVGRAGKECHDAVADEFVDDAIVAAHHGFHGAQVGVDEAEVFRRQDGFGQRGEIADVREQERHFLLDVIAQADIDNAGAFEQAQELARHKAAIRHFSSVQRDLFVRCRGVGVAHRWLSQSGIRSR